MRIYDSCPGFGKLREKEADNIDKRFPNAVKIIYPKIRMTQLDCISCGVYASALLTYFILTGIPQKIVKITRNVIKLHKHYVKILEDKDLSLFP